MTEWRQLMDVYFTGYSRTGATVMQCAGVKYIVPLLHFLRGRAE